MKKLWNKELPVWLNCLHLLCRAFQLAVLVFFAYNVYLTISTRQTFGNPMLYFFAFIIPGQVYNRIAFRNGLKDNKQTLRQYDHLFLRYGLLAIAITAIFVTACVLYFNYKTE